MNATTSGAEPKKTRHNLYHTHTLTHLMDNEKIYRLCIAMAKDSLEISTYAGRSDKEGVDRQFSQIRMKMAEITKALEE